jgi:hypothetical protein
MTIKIYFQEGRVLMADTPEATIVVPISSEGKNVGTIELKPIAKDTYSAKINLEFPIKNEGNEIGKIKISTDDQGNVEPSANFVCPVVHNKQEMGTLELTVEKSNMVVNCKISPENLIPKGGISKPKLF